MGRSQKCYSITFIRNTVQSNTCFGGETSMCTRGGPIKITLPGKLTVLPFLLQMKMFLLYKDILPLLDCCPTVNLLLIGPSRSSYSDWQWHLRVPDRSSSYYLLSHPTNGRCWGLNLGPHACKRDVFSMGYGLSFFILVLKHKHVAIYSWILHFSKDDLIMNDCVFSWFQFIHYLRLLCRGERPHFKKQLIFSVQTELFPHCLQA